MVTVVLHCSASNFGNAALIEQWHLGQRVAGDWLSLCDSQRLDRLRVLSRLL